MKKPLFSMILLLSSVFLIAQKKLRPPAPDNSKLPEVFDSYIKSALQEWKTPGLSIVVVKNSNVVFKKVYGVQNLINKTPYTASTLSTCASTTKAMTAVCMGMLVDEGKIKWSDVVSDILPEFKLADLYATAEITIKDLFTHNTGLGNADMLWVLGYSRSEIVKRMQFLPPVHSLRSSYTYQNLMYLVAGEVIKKISGKSWDEFITERIFLPLGMNNTFSDYSKIPASFSKTTPHFKDIDDKDSIKTISYLADDNIGPAGGVWSCVNDISKWLIFLSDSAKVNGKQLLKPGTFAELFKPHAIIPEGMFYPTTKLTKPHWTTYGLGWFQHDYRGKMVQFHTGSLAGLVAICGMIPDDRIAVYVFGNLDHSEIRHALMYKAFDLWTSDDNTNNWSSDFYKLYKGIADTAQKKEKEDLSKQVKGTYPSLPLAQYAGKYINKVYGGAEVIFTNDSLTLKFTDGKFYLSLQHWNYDTFRGSYNYWWWGKLFVQFSFTATGKVSGLSVDGVIYDKENQK
jgi:CubicO group peptidase (beta-lactamase class C family)